MTDYLADVRRYDAAADEAVVAKIVKHLGIALRSRDASLVAASDAEELARVRTSWIGKKLGIEDAEKADAVIASVAETMKGDHNKQRVTFYYLTAKALGKLESL
ncbi:DUF2853 family protein [Pseudochrobactrum sp. sp1633]|uniref:DUF2853 family protein n=1 Tax=Pseudochrobactrum sp. sp1633 TaxID=3036706 RepID=UPI0025A5BCB4|nr:DUF2853 family protein [Pseudochrobactrum sp. sp1633]MDM8345426.1 DUF2853 family protein [Pseudochrobactrum sp. sp1633]HWD13053.1 DUF2853 family protein [Pseudochrobactrum sp.]